MSDREEQLKRDIWDLQAKLAQAIRPRDKIVEVPVEVIRYVEKVVEVERVKEVNFMVEVIKTSTVDRPCKVQAARIAELEAQLSIMERECQAL